MVQTEVTILQKDSIAPAWWRLTLAAPDLTSRPLPGQFLLLRCADRFSCYLRRPIYPGPVDGDRLSLLVQPDPDPGLAWLAARQPGDRLDVIGPLGSGFPLDPQTRHLLLVSDGQAIDPLLAQIDRAVAAGVAVTLALGSKRTETLYPISALPPIVEFQAATLDGSTGHRGLVTDLTPDLLRWADTVCVTGSMALYRTLKEQVDTVRFRMEPDFLFGLIGHRPMACGVGACLSCAIETSEGLRLTCVDGPVFDLMRLYG